jgi:ribosomal protein L24
MEIQIATISLTHKKISISHCQCIKKQSHIQNAWEKNSIISKENQIHYAKNLKKKMHWFSLQEIRTTLQSSTTNRIKIINYQIKNIQKHEKTWIRSAAEFCWRNHNRRFLSNRVCSRRFFLSLSFVLRPPKSTRLRLEGSPLKNMFDFFQLRYHQFTT